jgi:hypothetical protein
MFVAVKTFRDKENNGIISFGKALKMGTLIALIGSTMYVITWALLYNLVMPDFMEIYMQQMAKSAQASSQNPTEVQAQISEMTYYKDLYKNPLFFTLMTYAEILPVGLVVALITAAILKKKPAQQTSIS